MCTPFVYIAPPLLLLQLSKAHAVMPLSAKCGALVEKGYDPKYAAVALQLANNDATTAHELVQLMLRRRAQLLPEGAADFTQDSGSGHYVTADTPVSDGAEGTTQQESAPHRHHTPRKRREGSATSSPEDEQLSEIHSEESNWEVVDVKCPVCHADDPEQLDQMIPCSICAQQYHTLCVGLRRIPFNMKTDKDRVNHAKYVRKHYADWRCEGCVACAADLQEGASELGNHRFSSKSSLSSLGSAANSRSTSAKTNDGSTISSGMAQRMAAQGLPASASRGGGVIITDAVRTPVNPANSGDTAAATSGRPNLSVSTNKGKASLLFPSRNVVSGENSPAGSKVSTPSKPTAGVGMEDSHSHSSGTTMRTPGPAAAMAGGNASAVQHLMSPGTRSKTDQVAILMGLLASHGLSAEDLVGMPEAKQKETLVNLMAAHNGGGLSNSNMSASGTSDGGREEKHQDLASALKGLIAKTSAPATAKKIAAGATPAGGDKVGLAERSASGDGGEPAFDARTAMLEVIRRKAAQASAAPAAATSAAGPAPVGMGASTPGGAYGSIAARAAALSGVPAGGVGQGAAGAGPAEGPVINNSEFAKYFKMIKVGGERLRICCACCVCCC
jgi:hypothetical protein